jgi:hypothetical protein
MRSEEVCFRARAARDTRTMVPRAVFLDLIGPFVSPQLLTSDATVRCSLAPVGGLR